MALSSFHYHSDNHTSNSDEEILIDIPEDEWPKVRDVYKRDWPYGIYPYYTIQNFIKWKKKGCADKINIYCPKGGYEDGTTIIVSNTDTIPNIHIFTYDKECKQLKEALLKTKVLKWSLGYYFYAVHEDHWFHLNEILTKLSVQTEYDVLSGYHWITKEKALQFNIECCPDVYVAPLKTEDVAVIESVWPHKYPGSDIYLKKLIHFNGGLGVFSKIDNSLCSWILKNHLLGLGVLQTVEEHKKKGYAKLLIKTISKSMAEEGIDIHTCIVRHNSGSLNLFKNLGFNHVDNIMCKKIKGDTIEAEYDFL